MFVKKENISFVLDSIKLSTATNVSAKMLTVIPL